MDSLVALAVMRKAQLAFELDGNFMSFPLTPRAYAQEDFAFVQADPSPGQIVVFREFSDMVDQVPRGSIVDSASEERLSAVYTDVLTGGEAQLAASTRTEAENVKYENAVNILYSTKGDGTRAETALMTTYRQYRDAWFTLRLEINNRKIDAGYSMDPIVAKKWKEVDEPALQKQLEDLEREWSVKGGRVEVEQALQTIDTLEAKSPARAWDGWRKRCLDEIDRPTDPTTNQEFWPSGFSPSNAFVTGGWIPFTLEGGAVTSLAKDAPAGLRGRWGDQVDLEIERLSFECTSLRVERSWFSNALFDARFWKLPKASEALSDGTSLDSGRCPAYIAAVVLARQIKVTLKAESSRNMTVLERFKTAAYLPFGNLKLAPTIGTVAGRPVLRDISPVRMVKHAAVADAHFAPPLGAIAVGHVATPSAGFGHGAVTAHAVLGHPDPHVVTKNFAMVKLGAFATNKRPDPPPTPSPTVDPSVHVLGFICKHVPLSPNPKKGLKW